MSQQDNQSICNRSIVLKIRKSKLKILYSIITVLIITCIILVVHTGITVGVNTKSVRDEIYDNKKIIDGFMKKYINLYNNVTHLRGYINDTRSVHSSNYISQSSMIRNIGTNLTLNIESVEQITNTHRVSNIQNISYIIKTLMVYRDEFRNNITVMLDKIKGINKVVSLNYNRTINSENFILKRLDKTENITSVILKKLNNIFVDNAIQNNSINIMRRDIEKVQYNVEEGQEGYKIYWNDCPYNWTINGYLKPFYICSK